MRTNRLEDPRSWRAWDGREFSVAFVDPYTAAPGTNPAKHVCAPVAPAEIDEDVAEPHLQHVPRQVPARRCRR